MHFHSNSKFRFNKKIHSFINAPFKKKRTKNEKSNFMHSNMYFQNSYSMKNFMHSYMHSSKIIKQKKIMFYAFINAFFLKKNKIKKTKRINLFKHALSFRKFTNFHVFINAFLKKIISKRQKELMHSSMHFYSENSQNFTHL